MIKSKTILILVLSILILSCHSTKGSSRTNDETVIIKNVNRVINDWHNAAAQANFELYFNYMTKDAIYIGTDANENWQNKDFKSFCKPYFDKGKAWNFKSLERNIYVSKNKKLVWFDELLDTQMKLCRGSGTLIRKAGKWKIAHYVLSITVPNEKVLEVVAIKKPYDSLLVAKKSDKVKK